LAGGASAVFGTAAWPPTGDTLWLIIGLVAAAVVAAAFAIRFAKHWRRRKILAETDPT
jgi:hypothetical protein